MPDAEKQSWQSRCFVPIKQCALHKLRRQEMRIATGANALAMTRSGNRSCVSFQNVGAAIGRPLPQCDARQTDEQRLLLLYGQFSSCSPLRIRFKTVCKLPKVSFPNTFHFPAYISPFLTDTNSVICKIIVGRKASLV